MAPLQRVIFSQKPLYGFIKVGGHFSIYPAHQWVNLTEVQSWPYRALERAGRKEGSNFGPPYPLFFEIDHPGSISSRWYEEAFVRLERYERLALLFIVGLESAAHQTSPDRWSAFEKMTADKLEISYGIVSFGFAVVGEASLARFIAEGGNTALPYQAEADGNYYDGLHVSDVLDYPNELEKTMDRYAALSPKAQKDFDRAAFFFHQGEFLRNGKFAPFTSYSSAIECLLDKQSEKCGSCGQEKYGIARRFTDFVERFAPISGPTRSQQKKMYQHRSKETHGVSVPHTDKEGMFKSFDANSYLFPWVVRKALVNWLIFSNLRES